jgi:hypothetical protein
MTALRLLTAVLLLVVGAAPGQEPVAGTFRAVDLFVDSGNEPLAAYQLSFACTVADAKIVGIEGGEHRAFAEPPYYDPKAMQNNHVVVAAFNTTSPGQLPRGRTRIATIHIQTSATGAKAYELNVDAAATLAGEPITVSAQAIERTAK